jgi:transposase
LLARAAAKKSNDVKGEGTVSKKAAIKWFQRFDDGHTSLKDQPRAGRPSVMNNHVLLELVEEQLQTSTR